MADYSKRQGKSKWRKRLQEVVHALTAFAHTPFFGWCAFVALSAAITIVATISFQHIPTRIAVGMIAARDLKADRNYDILDQEATKTFQQEAVEAVPPVLDLDPERGQLLLDRVTKAFSEARDALGAWKQEQDKLSRKWRKDLDDLPEEQRERISELFTQSLGVEIEPKVLRPLFAERFSERVEQVVIAALQAAMTKPILQDDQPIEVGMAKNLVIRTIGESEEKTQEQVVEDPGKLPMLEEVRKALAERLRNRPDLKSEPAVAAIAAIASKLVQSNTQFNRQEYLKRRDLAKASAKNVVIKIKAGEMIIREGSRVEPWHVKVIEGMREERRYGGYHLEFAGTFLLIMLFLILPFRLLERFSRRIRVTPADQLLMALLSLTVLLVMRFSLSIAPAIADEFLFSIDPTILHYAVPIAGGAMLLRMFLAAEVSFVFAIVMSVLAGLFVEVDVRFVAYSLITSMAGIMAIAHVDRRGQIIQAGAITGAVGALAALGIRLIVIATSTGAFSISDMIASMFFAFLGGIGCAIFTMIGAPIIEALSDYTSDIKLLELANLNHPLLRELIVRAPGTYHHSHVVGLLGEAAATEIGANALLVRVGAYYHDIGKLKKPLYFVENMRAGDDRYDRLTPHMSALIVSAHVKDGLDLAQTAKIPKIISDMIPQHHGSRQISFFYNKAKSQEDPDVMKVDPKDFQYPGPKPQSREAAILMLADVTEASVRALKEKSPARIEQTVQRTIHDIFNESQLDDCELTLRDLNDIGKAFQRILLGIYHSRIEYAKEVEHAKQEVEAKEEDTIRESEPDQRAPKDTPAVD